MEEIIIHVGQAKTGTTSIQKFFTINRDNLLRQGILYPKLSIGNINHAGLSVPALGMVQRSLVPLMGAGLDDAIVVSRRLWAELGQAVASHNPRKLVISSEFLFDTPNVQTLIDLVREFVSPNARIKFLVYLRQRSSYFASGIQQYLKASSQLLPLDDADPCERACRFVSFGNAEIRLFSRDALVGGNIISDICTLLEVDTNELTPVNGRENEAISAEGTILLQEYRRLKHSDKDDVFTDDTAHFISKILQEEAREKGKYTALRVKPAVAQYLDRETEGVEFLRSKCGVDLYSDHSAAALSRDQIMQLSDVKDVVEFNPLLLEDLRASVRHLF